MITKQGTVVKKSGDKTVRVEVHSYRAHPKYKKKFRTTNQFLAHDEENKIQEGDVVTIQQTRPVSKKKSWVVISIDIAAITV